LQFIGENVDPSLLQIENESTKELLAYIADARARAAAQSH
jgi:hypothetical protein